MKNITLVFLGLLTFLIQIENLQALTVYQYQGEKDCSSEQLQLEKHWTNYKVSPDTAQSEDDLNPQCMLYAMTNFEAWARKRPYFAQCSSDTAEVIRTSAGVCRTQNMVENLNHLYNRFTKCFELPPKFFFLVISSESGFILNAFAPGMDIGLGQLTKPGIDDVTNNWERLTAPLKNSNSPHCQELKSWYSELQIAPSETEVACAFVATPKNPARNLLYSLLLHQQNRTYFINLLANPEVESQLATLLKSTLSETEKFQLIDSYALLTYNMGYERLSGLLTEFLRERLKKAPNHQVKIESLSAQIIELKAQLPKLNLEGNTRKARQVRDQITELEAKQGELFEAQRQPILTLDQLDPLQTKAGAKSFWAFLKDKKQSNYVDLILGRVAHVDRLLGSGACTQTNNLFTSPSLKILN